VQSYLENPTTYHLQKSRDKKVQAYLSETYGNKFAAHPPAASPGVRPSHVMSSSAGNSAPNSPMAMLNIGSNSAGNGAPNSPMAMLNIGSNPEREFDEVIDDIMRLDDVLGYMNPEVHMPNTLPMSSSHMNVYSGDPQVTASLVGVTSSSRPAKLTPSPALAASSPPSLPSHPAVERRRRFNINDRIKELGMLIPKANDLDVRWNKGTILKASVDYIKRMQKDLQRSRDLENHSRRLEMTNKQLLLRIQELEMQARVHGLPTSSPSGVNVAELAQHASFPSVSKKELDLMLMQDTMLPLASDPLFSAMSPEASKASSRRSSFSMEDADML
ncbi:Transcription factor EB, partial [Phalacrocorax carbo]